MAPNDRRLLIQQLLHQAFPAGLTARELEDLVAKKAADAGDEPVSKRTILRDLETMRDMLDDGEGPEPLRSPDRRYRLRPDEYPVRSVELKTPEARALLFAARLFVHHASTRDEDAEHAFAKLAAAFEGPLADHLRLTLKELGNRPKPANGKILKALTRAWEQRRTVYLRYRRPGQERTTLVEVDPYLLEPGKNNSNVYLLAMRRDVEQVRVYVLDRIEDVEVTTREFERPADLEAVLGQMSLAWGGSIYGDQPADVVLRFTPEVAQRAREAHWHPSRVIEDLPDGGIVMRVSLPTLMDFTPFVLGWGPAVEVLEPASLREEVAALHRQAAEQYAA
jgi:predicted DNA-binding transcriptional regulator YafY